MKTIKQIADEIGVTKQAVSKRLSQLPPTEVATTDNGTKLISPHGESILKGLIKPTTNQSPPTEAPTVEPSPPTVDSDILKLLQDNLTVLQGQLAEKDKLINTLTEQNKDLNETIKIQAQSINADRHNELAGTLQMQLTDGATDKPKSRWERLKSAWKGE